MSFWDRLRDEVRAMRPYVPEEPGGGIRLDANESPFQPEGEEREAILAALEEVELNRYPEAGVPRLREAVAERLGVPASWVSIGNGSDEFLPILCTVFGKPPPGRARASILVPAPTFSMYRLCAEPLGLETREIALGPRFELDPGALSRAIAAGAPNLVFLATPNNPTGTWCSGEAVRAALAPGESVVVVDEAYGGFSGETHLGLLASHPQMVLLQSLSKVGLAALRLGLLVAHPQVVAEVDKVRLPYNVNALSACVAELLLRRFGPALEARIRRVVAERDRLAAELAALPGVTVYPSRANFLLFRVPGAGAIAAALRARGVVVRNLDRPGPLEHCLRVTVGTRAEDEVFLDALRDLLGVRSGERIR
jgi:histidinol-phosphate aminotransferase